MVLAVLLSSRRCLSRETFCGEVYDYEARFNFVFLLIDILLLIIKCLMKNNYFLKFSFTELKMIY